MSIFRASDFSELVDVIGRSSNGDEILFTSTNYTATQNLVVSKSLTFSLITGIDEVTIDFSGTAFEIHIDGQAGGTNQSWFGPIVITGSTSTGCETGNIINGEISLLMEDITFSSCARGFDNIASGLFKVTSTLNRCIAHSNTGWGLTSGGTSGLGTLVLNDCVARDNSGTGLRLHQTGNLIANNTISKNNATRQVYGTGSATGTITDCEFITKTTSSQPMFHLSCGDVTFLRCTGTCLINQVVFSSTSNTITMRECDFTNSSTSSDNQTALFINSSSVLRCFDCNFTQTGNLTIRDMFQMSGAIILKRCVIDASQSTGTIAATVYLVDAVGRMDLEGNVFIATESENPSQKTWCVNTSGANTTSSISHNTFARTGSGGAPNNGLNLVVDIPVRGNVFAGFDNGVTAVGTSDYTYNVETGYNVFYNNFADVDGGAIRATDIPDTPYSPFLDFINKDLRQVISGVGNKLDPGSAAQIDYHQVEVVIKGEGQALVALSPDINAADAGPTDAGAYNNPNTFITITLTAVPDTDWVFGRWEGDTASTENPFTFTITSSQLVTAYFFSEIVPHLTAPKGGEIFNLGKVDILWNTNNPLALNANVKLSYEIEYTDNYIGNNDTNWYTLKRRIPWNTTEFEWVVGKSIKSETVRLRLRARESDGSFSDWSTMGGDFAVNVFKLIPPAIISPLGNHVYTDFLLIILDETLTRDTFNQKVRYTMEYFSDKREIDWTVIAKDIPVGQNVIRWDLEDVPPSDDYVLRLTAKNAATSCLPGQEPTPDQISRRFVYSIKIQQPGMFLIDTQPPQAILDIESSAGITNQLTQTLNIFAEDATSEVEQIQLRECKANGQLALGNVDAENFGITDCDSVESLLNLTNPDFDTLIGKPLGYSAKTQWIFEDESGLRRLEALLTDSGGNSSLQGLLRTFIPVFRTDEDPANDIIIVKEQRDIPVFAEDPTTGIITVTEDKNVDFEVAYVGTQGGKYWSLEPFPRLAGEISGRQIRLLIEFFDVVYLLTYVNSSGTPDTGSVYRDDKIQLTNIFDFDQDSLRIPTAVAIFQNVLYIGLENGELWSFDGVGFTLLNTFINPISALTGDNIFLYIGQANSSAFVLYNGSIFTESDLES